MQHVPYSRELRKTKASRHKCHVGRAAMSCGAARFIVIIIIIGRCGGVDENQPCVGNYNVDERGGAHYFPDKNLPHDGPISYWSELQSSSEVSTKQVVVH